MLKCRIVGRRTGCASPFARIPGCRPFHPSSSGFDRWNVVAQPAARGRRRIGDVVSVTLSQIRHNLPPRGTLVSICQVQTTMAIPASPYVLVVDDSQDGREMLTEYLQFRGFNVIASPDGEAALRQALAQPPAIILMDLQMPGITGWDATRRLKAHPATKDVVVIALTAHAMAPDEGIARQAGCDAFIPKPFDITRVGNVVEAVLTHGRAALDGVGDYARTQAATSKKKPRPASTGRKQDPR
jgi:two-component system cell cycle response regulator DivK